MPRTRILIVDDDQATLRALEQLLGGEGFVVDMADTGSAALELAHNHPPDLVLTDLQMPEMDGIALCRALTKLSPELPVIVATGLADTASAVKALHAGAEDYLTKPLDFDALLVSIQLAMNRRAAMVERQQLRACAEELYQQAIAAVQAHEEVLSIVSHDLRNPLAVIAASAQQLLRAPSPGPVEIAGSDVRSVASRILRGSARMERLITDLLDQARIRGGRLAVEPAAHRVSELLADISELRPLAQQKQVLIQIEPPAQDRLLCCDRARIAQALGNLLANAIRFSPAGGTVSVSVEDVTGGVRFNVRDQGPGIAPEALPKIFDRFWQSRKSGSVGVGLGLYIVKGIVESHGGQVGVETRLGFGCTFHILLPDVPASAEQR